MAAVTTSRARDRARSFVLVGLLAAVTAFAMHHEGYVPLVGPVLGVGMIAGFAVVAWLAAAERPCRVAALFLVIFVIEYAKESIGVRSGLWTYHGRPGQYVFGVWLWVMAGAAAYALAKKAVPLLRRVRASPPRWVNTVVVVAVASVIPITLGGYRHGTGIAFAAFYGALAVAGVAASLRMSFPSLAGLVLAAWIVANPSEYIGSMGSGIWTYPLDPSYPPVFLLFGCWPLEIIAQVSLSALLASESLDLSPAGGAEEFP